MRRACPGLRGIMDARNRAENLRFYNEAAEEDGKARLYQNFISDSSKHFNSKEILRRAKIKREEYNERLLERRNKLMNLLQAEDLL